MIDDPTELEAAVLAAAPDDAEVVVIDPSLADTAAFCEAYGYAMDASANCIVVASRDEEPVVAACLVLATMRLDVNKVVRKHLGVRKLSFAAADVTRDMTGMEIGGVTPFGLPDALPLLIDATVMERDRVIVGGGSRRLKLLVPPAALAALPNAQVVPALAKPPAS